jgi:hypothetical protein
LFRVVYWKILSVVVKNELVVGGCTVVFVVTVGKMSTSVTFSGLMGGPVTIGYSNEDETVERVSGSTKWIIVAA